MQLRDILHTNGEFQVHLFPLIRTAFSSQQKTSLTVVDLGNKPLGVFLKPSAVTIWYCI